jgi:hypothetical protein
MSTIVQKKMSRRIGKLPALLEKQLKFEFLDTLISMIIGRAIKPRWIHCEQAAVVALNALLLADMAKNYL